MQHMAARRNRTYDQAARGSQRSCGRRAGGQVSEKQDRWRRRAPCAGSGIYPLVAPLVRLMVGDCTGWLTGWSMCS